MDPSVGKIPSKITIGLPVSFKTRHILPARIGETTIQTFTMDLRFLRQVILPRKTLGFTFRQQAPQ